MKAMTDEEHAQWKKERAEKNAARARGKTEKKERLAKALESGQRVVIDLEFPHLMNESEQRSMAHQVAYSYGSNTRSSTPAHLILSGVHGTTQEHLVHAFPGFSNWVVTSTEKPYLEHFSDSKNKLVYLTADSPTELQELDPESIYIIGGIVDRNRHKNLCYNKAVEQGIATARLPLGSNKIKLASSMVMCTNHVVDIMLKWMEMKDWDAAFEAVIPTRKRKVGDEGGEGSKEQKIEGEDAKSGGDDCKDV
jgi:tRNA (guanine9-N1)-methyltransferase